MNKVPDREKSVNVRPHQATRVVLLSGTIWKEKIHLKNVKKILEEYMGSSINDITIFTSLLLIFTLFSAKALVM